MEGKSKCDNIRNIDTRKMQDFMLDKSLENSRMEVLWLTNMWDTRTTMKAKYNKQYNCPHCADGRESGTLESPSPLMEWKTYADLRQGINPELVQNDRPRYLRRVIARRKELEAKLKKTIDDWYIGSKKRTVLHLTQIRVLMANKIGRRVQARVSRI